MDKAKQHLVKEYLAQWQSDLLRAKPLLESDEYFVEGLLVLVCYIGALARVRYPQEQRDWKSYKTIVREYGGKKDLYENIDLLFFCQWPKSKMANAKIYRAMKNHSKIVSIIQEQFGDEEAIKNSTQRYQTREALVALIKGKNPLWFDEGNFIEHIELFSNNQIFYEILRCEAVHNADFPLFNRKCGAGQGKMTYKDNHQITRQVILETVQNILSNIEKECLAQSKWPWEISCV
jgi:hypothetical protein